MPWQTYWHGVSSKTNQLGEYLLLRLLVRDLLIKTSKLTIQMKEGRTEMSESMCKERGQRVLKEPTK